MSLATPANLRRLQRALYVTAKRDPARRFDVLYDKVWREDILAHAFALSRKNGGAPGVDGVTFAQIEAYGVARWLGELREEVRTGRYTPQPGRRRCVVERREGERAPTRRTSARAGRSLRPIASSAPAGLTARRATDMVALWTARPASAARQAGEKTDRITR
ncbi:MAG: hypothetical protein HY294_15895 [Candidatus Rokubacteria bacterium]|nr:hypothetical protein [Candidatus Rokubacteria bacterium]